MTDISEKITRTYTNYFHCEDTELLKRCLDYAYPEHNIQITGYNNSEPINGGLVRFQCDSDINTDKLPAKFRRCIAPDDACLIFRTELDKTNKPHINATIFLSTGETKTLEFDDMVTKKARKMLTDKSWDTIIPY